MRIRGWLAALALATCGAVEQASAQANPRAPTRQPQVPRTAQDSLRSRFDSARTAQDSAAATCHPNRSRVGPLAACRHGANTMHKVLHFHKTSLLARLFCLDLTR